MSLSAPQPERTFSVGILAAKNLDDPGYLAELIGSHLAEIGHIYTNGANQLVVDFSRENGIPCTIHPINGGRGLPASTRAVVEASEFVYIIGTPDSKSAKQVEEVCAAKQARDDTFAYRLYNYEPINHWREKVCKAAEILAGMTTEERKANEWAKAVWRVLG